MTITLLIIIITNCLNMLITGILIIRQLRANKKKVKKNGKKRAKKTKKIKAKVTDGKNVKRSKTGSKTQKKQVIDLDPNNYIQNLAKEALETSNEIKDMTGAK